MMISTLNKRYLYYSWQEVLATITGAYSEEPYTLDSSISFNLQNLSPNPETERYTPSDVDFSSDIFLRFLNQVYALFYNYGVIRFKVEPWNYNIEITNEELLKEYKIWRNKFYSKLLNTYNYYMPILTVYANNKDNLLSQVKSQSSSTRKYNDTPQGDTSSGTYETDSYLTNLTRNESESVSDYDTIMGRINEIQSAYKNVEREWLDEIRGLFYEVDIKEV